MPAFAPVLIPAGGDDDSLDTSPVLDGNGILILFASDVAYSRGNVEKSSTCHATTIGSSTARPVVTVTMLELVDVVGCRAELSYPSIVCRYEVPPVKVMSAWAWTGVEKVLMQTSGNSGPNPMPLWRLMSVISLYDIQAD